MNRQCSLYYLLALSLVLSVPSKVPGAEPAPATIDFSGASSTQTWGINARGEIVGFYVLDSVTHGFWLRWNQFRTIDVPGAASTSALAINERGEMAGSYVDASGVTHGFVLSRGQFTTIDFPGALSTEVLGINSRGEIVGDYSVTGTTPCCASGTHGFLRRLGHYTSLNRSTW